MLQSLRIKIVAGVAFTLLCGSAVVGAFAATDAAPSADPTGSDTVQGPVLGQLTELDAAILEGHPIRDRDRDNDPDLDQCRDPESRDPESPDCEPRRPQDPAADDAGGVTQGPAGAVLGQPTALDASVPAGSPERDRDRDQCRDPESTGCEPQNLQARAGYGVEGVPPGPPEGVPPGPPEGVPPGPPEGVPAGPPEGVPSEPPEGVPYGPPEDVPHGPPEDVPPGPPEGVPYGRPHQQ